MTPMATPMSAVMMGRPAAMSVPSITNRTMAATMRPTSSPPPMTSGIPDAMDDEKSIPTPSTGLERKAVMSASLVATLTAVCGASNMTAATAALPSFDTSRTPDARSRSVAPASSLWVSAARRAGAASISACCSWMVVQPASMSAWPSASF